MVQKPNRCCINTSQKYFNCLNIQYSPLMISILQKILLVESHLSLYCAKICVLIDVGKSCFICRVLSEYSLSQTNWELSL